MENSSGSNISDILKEEGNSECCDCGAAEVKWISLNNGIFLCDKCAENHRTFGMSVSQILSLQLPTWSGNQLLFLKKGGNKNYKKNLTEYNIAPSASMDVKYKSKAASYYRRYLKNEVDKESDPKYVETTIIKPDLKDAEQIEEVIEEVPNEEKKEGEKAPANNAVGFMTNIFNKIKEGTIVAAKTVEKGFNDLNLTEKLINAGNRIAGVVKTSGDYVAEKTQQAANTEFVQNATQKTKQGYNAFVERTKTVIQNVTGENKGNTTEDKKENTEVKQEKIEGESQPQSENVLVKDNNLPGSNPPPKEEQPAEEKKEEPVPAPEGETQNAQS
jgi:ADP-ribosylation factor GTPase-activating protein 1